MENFKFKSTEFMSVEKKHQVIKAWERFIDSGFKFSQFTTALYNHLIQHCSFIAHYNRKGFWSTYFSYPRNLARFLRQFDESNGCHSVEYGTKQWLTCDEYADINQAMVKVLKPKLNDVHKQVITALKQQAINTKRGAEETIQKAEKQLELLEG